MSGAGTATELRPVASLQPHPQARELPRLTDNEYGALRDDIARRGVQVPLEVTADGTVLDGHARLRAAKELGLSELPTRPVQPKDPVEHMLLAALLRRQLTASQRAAVAVKLAELDELRAQATGRKLANLRQGADRASLPAPDSATADREGEAAEVASLPAAEGGEPGRVRGQIAALAGTSPRTVQDALTVREHDPAAFERALNGEIKVSTLASRIRRQLRDSALPEAPPLPEGPFELILADPPWSMGSPDSDFSPEQHYPCMPTSDIKAMNVPADEDCVLFLWAVNCLLPEALEVIRAWGFRYRNNLVWVKNGIGPGVWLRQRHELLLIATRGNASPPHPEERVDSVIEAARTRHSEKPALAYERIEQMYPQHSKLELFARNSRPGWASWGNQAPDNDQAAA